MLKKENAMKKNTKESAKKSENKGRACPASPASPAKKFLIATGISFVAFFVIASGVVVGFAFLGNNTATRMISMAMGLEVDEEGNPIAGGIMDFFDSGSLPERINVLLLGSDEAFGGEIGRSDMIMIVSVHSETGAVSMVSVPRDTHVVMPTERLTILRENGRNTAASSGVMRINEITHHSGQKLGPSFIMMQLEELLDIEIHYYVHVDLEGFRILVDQIGGIEFDVPRRMNYRDPYQNLVIDLQPGLQRLTGSAAEGLVRYRGYGDGDLGRMRVQQDFLREAMRQIMDIDSIMRNPLAYLSVFIDHMDTNFGLTDVPAHLPLLTALDMSDITTATLPGRGTSINGRYFHVLDEVEVEEIVAQIFHTAPVTLLAQKTDDETAITGTSLGLDIEILNGAGITGLAARTGETLAEYGYNIVSIGDYFGQRQAATRILVQQEGGGHDLTSFFPESRIEVDRTINTDIVIILGTSSN
jgi:LCP family protein required for cell wall assembly